MKTGIIIASMMLLNAACASAQAAKFKFTPKNDAQKQEYNEFMDSTKNEREMDDSLSYAEAKAYFDLSGDEDKLRPYTERSEQAQVAHEKSIDRFIELHPSYAVCAALVKHKMYQDFKYTAAYYDKFAKLVQACPDTSYTNFINRNISIAKKYTIGSRYTDFEGSRPAATAAKLSSLMTDGKYTLVDFWASWCGPCRSAIPKVKKMLKRYEDKLQVVSVSVDEKKDAWLKAEKEEAMSWPQLWLDKETLSRVAKAYMINTIPRLVLVNPAGEIEIITHNPTLIQNKLK